MTQDPLFLVSVNLFAAVLARILKPNLLTAVLLTVVMIGCAGYLASHHGTEIMVAVHQARDQAWTYFGHPPAWPPERYRTYPELCLQDQNGQPVRLSDFRGKVVLVEMVGMSCPACIAFSGGGARGAFHGVEPQPDLESIHEYVRRFGRIRLDDPRVVFVQIILFNREMQAPSQADLKEWADHFGFRTEHNQYVLGGLPFMATPAHYDLVPGFQLIDKQFVLQVDCTGSAPADNFYSDLLPHIRPLLHK